MDLKYKMSYKFQKIINNNSNILYVSTNIIKFLKI